MVHSDAWHGRVQLHPGPLAHEVLAGTWCPLCSGTSSRSTNPCDWDQQPGDPPIARVLQLFLVISLCSIMLLGLLTIHRTPFEGDRGVGTSSEGGMRPLLAALFVMLLSSMQLLRCRCASFFAG